MSTAKTKKPLANPTDGYAIGAALVTEKLARLQALADDHFGADPDTLNWGHVGSLRYVEELLTQALDHIDPTRAEETTKTCGASFGGRSETRSQSVCCLAAGHAGRHESR